MVMDITFQTVKQLFLCISALCLTLYCAHLKAYDEIQIYDMSINKPGQLVLEMHSNYVIDGRKNPDYTGALPPDGNLAFTSEFSYGLTRYIELGIYVPMSINTLSGASYEDNTKFRLKLLNADNLNLFYGVNTELGLVPKRYSEQFVGMEIRPIIGHYTGEWLVSLNPSLEIDLTGNNQIPGLSPGLKVTRQVINNVHIGVEHYADFGGFNRFLPGHEQDHTTYLVTDISKDNYRFHVGVGHGWTAASDAWMLKLILGGIPLGELINPNRW
ncbi:MAG: hypothetical protein NTY69_06200 [Methylococcales bacterium]|nr:hypothetical protein [Methylococcales bacterium]